MILRLKLFEFSAQYLRAIATLTITKTQSQHTTVHFKIEFELNR